MTLDHEEWGTVRRHLIMTRGNADASKMTAPDDDVVEDNAGRTRCCRRSPRSLAPRASPLPSSAVSIPELVRQLEQFVVHSIVLPGGGTLVAATVIVVFSPPWCGARATTLIVALEVFPRERAHYRTARIPLRSLFVVFVPPPAWRVALMRRTHAPRPARCAAAPSRARARPLRSHAPALSSWCSRRRHGSASFAYQTRARLAPFAVPLLPLRALLRSHARAWRR